jgi:hypothetical protein
MKTSMHSVIKGDQKFSVNLKITVQKQATVQGVSKRALQL